MSLHYHLGKANVTADTLSRLSIESLSHIDKDLRGLVNDIYRLANSGFHILDSKYGGIIFQEMVRSSLGAEVKEKQTLDPILI